MSDPKDPKVVKYLKDLVDQIGNLIDTINKLYQKRFDCKHINNHIMFDIIRIVKFCAK